jgi:hypothetical protein
MKEMRLGDDLGDNQEHVLSCPTREKKEWQVVLVD